mgnify:CR=1 FL=1
MSLLRIGTRGSPLAMVQTTEAARKLAAANPELAAAEAIEIIEIKTTGDAVLDRALADVGGKGLFSKELDAAQIDGRIDIAVHSLKDLETLMPDGVIIAAYLEREDPRDAIIARPGGLNGSGLDGLAHGATLGTASLRRQAQVLHRRPDLNVVLIRGNVQTRLGKLENGDVDATLLALAGLNRLGLAERASHILEPEEMLPAVGQGVVAITCRSGDARVADWLAKVNHPPTATRITAERALLAALDGSCRTPVGGYAEISDDGGLWLRGLVARADGSELYATERHGSATDAEAIGRDAGEELRRRAGDDIFD